MVPLDRAPLHPGQPITSPPTPPLASLSLILQLSIFSAPTSSNLVSIYPRLPFFLPCYLLVLLRISRCFPQFSLLAIELVPLPLSLAAMPTLNPEEIDPRDLPPLSPGDNGGLSPDYAHSNPRSEPTSNLLKDSDHPNLEITEDYLLSATSFLDAITDVNPIEPFAITSHINKCAQATDSRTIDLDALAECLARGDEKVAVMARCEEWPKFPPMLIMSVVGEDREDQDEGKRRLEFCDIGDLKATIADIDRVITWVATNP